MSVPVARWSGAGIGAVLSIEWMYDDDPDDPDYICTEVRPFLPSDAGWESTGASGGGGWFDPPFDRPTMGAATLQTCGIHIERSDDVTIAAVWGVAGALVEVVEVVHRGTAIRRNVESPFGAVVAAVRGDGPAELVAYLADGTEVGRSAFGVPRRTR